MAESVAVRRREVGTGSARSLLLTVLGEFVHPRGEPVWTTGLVRALALLGVEEKSARQAIARSAAEDILRPDRVGRRVRWTISPAGTTLLADGTRRIYSFQRGLRPWDGRWLVLSVAVPENLRQLRHRLRTRLTWLGLGSPVAGLWVVPDASREAAVAEVIRELDLADRVFLWVGSGTSVGEPAAVVDASWSLADVAAAYREFLDAFVARTAPTDAAAFAAQVQLVQAWRRFPFLDPALPPELLRPDWPGADAARAFHRLHAAWQPGAQRHWTSLVGITG